MSVVPHHTHLKYGRFVLHRQVDIQTDSSMHTKTCHWKVVKSEDSHIIFIHSCLFSLHINFDRSEEKKNIIQISIVVSIIQNIQTKKVCMRELGWFYAPKTFFQFMVTSNRVMSADRFSSRLSMLNWLQLTGSIGAQIQSDVVLE